jgi:hypothetical protein
LWHEKEFDGQKIEELNVQRCRVVSSPLISSEKSCGAGGEGVYRKRQGMPGMEVGVIL